MSEELQRRTYHHGGLIDAVLDEVGQIIERHGSESVSLRACAKKVGVSHSALFRHFADKRDVLTAFAVRSAHQMVRFINERTDQVPENEKFLAAGCAYVDFAIQHTGPFRLIFREDLIDATRPDYRSAMNRMSAVLATGGHGGGNDMALTPKALLAWASVHGMAMLCVDGSLSRDVAEDKLKNLVRQTLQHLGPILRAPADVTSMGQS